MCRVLQHWIPTTFHKSIKAFDEVTHLIRRGQHSAHQLLHPELDSGVTFRRRIFTEIADHGCERLVHVTHIAVFERTLFAPREQAAAFDGQKLLNFIP